MTMYGDEEGEFVDDDFVQDVLNLADDNIDGVLQVEGKGIKKYNFV